MILVDTSILIDLFKGHENDPVRNFRLIIQQQVPFGISSVIYQEVLQGARNKKEYDSLDEYLSTQLFFNPKDPIKSFADAAKIYYRCRKKGITIRSTIDCLIAQTALEHKLILLHNDKDFTAISTIIDLQTYSDNY